MKGLQNMLLQEKRRLEEIVSKAKAEVAIAPEGSLRISKDKKKLRFYHCIDTRNGNYISKKDTQLPRQLAQKHIIFL